MTHERPILFNSQMVQAVLAGTKTQTRRVVKPQPEIYESRHGATSLRWRGGVLDTPLNIAPYQLRQLCPHGAIGDRLWVRETWASDDSTTAYYRADGETYNAGLPWRPSIFMPRWASRLTLEITDVRVERVQDISRKDAKDEGVLLNFHLLWDAINAERGYSWDSNPWVWAISFQRVQQ